MYVHTQTHKGKERERDTLLKLAYTIMKAEKSHDVLSASWRGEPEKPVARFSPILKA